MSSRPGDYAMLWIGNFVVSFIASVVGQLTCFLGFFIAWPWAMAVQGYLCGRYAGWLDAEEGPAP